MPETEYIDLIPVIVRREKAVMPKGFDSWGVKSVRPDLKTYSDFQWPTPGRVAACDESRIDRGNKGVPHVHHRLQGLHPPG